MKDIKIKSIRLKVEKTIKYDFETITDALTLYNIMKKIGVTEKSNEHAYLIGLDNHNNITHIANIGIGGLDYVFMDTRVIFQHLYISNSVKFILVHNHPSQDLKPSRQDLEVTEKIQRASNLLGFTFLDHLIITDGAYQSIFKYIEEEV